MSENCIEVQNVSKSFVGRKVVDDLTLVVKKGETYGLLGHNGAGKTTLFRYVVDRNEKYEGNILLDGKNIRSNHSDFMNQIAYISDEAVFFLQKTAMENAKICKRFIHRTSSRAYYVKP